MNKIQQLIIIMLIHHLALSSTYTINMVNRLAISYYAKKVHGKHGKSSERMKALHQKSI